MNTQHVDVIIIGGSYSGLASGMALGRALKDVLIIDSGEPCNRQTPHSHNFITHDGDTPAAIAMLARTQMEKYSTIQFLHDEVTHAQKHIDGFEIQTASGKKFSARKLIFATGLKDIMPAIPGFDACWGISVLHCPYCHGYEVRHAQTGIIGNGDYGFEFSILISNWTNNLTLFTNGISNLSEAQTVKLQTHNIKIIEHEIARLEHSNGQVQHMIFKDSTPLPIKVLYARCGFEQHSAIPQALGCVLTEEGYIKTDALQKTSVDGVYACGDNTTKIRTLANAVSMGTTANKDLVFESFS